MSPGEGFGVQVGCGGWFPVENKRRRGGGGGGGVGTGKGIGKSMRTRLSKLPFSKLLFCLFSNNLNINSPALLSVI